MNKKGLLAKAVVLTVGVSFSFGFTDMLMKDDVLEKTKSFVEETKRSMKASSKVEGLEVRQLPEYSPYIFKSRSENPFLVKGFVRLATPANGVESAEDACSDDLCGDGAPVAHTPFFLESYALDQLSMIGTMTDRSRGKVALIQTPDAGVVYAKSGEYIGKNNGLILSVNSDRLIIREKYRSAEGWQDRMARLPLLKN